MNRTARRSALAASAAAFMLILGSGIAAAAPTTGPTTELIQPVVRLGQTDPVAAFLECALTGFIPLIGPNVIFPICLA
ncbi:hypothetical protein ACWFRB_01790 [Rhodococcus sp. NPDC055112]